MKMNFRGKLQGEESVMDTSNLNITEIRFNINSKQLDLIIDEGPKFTESELSGLSWQALKAMVLDNGGTWSNTNDAKAFLLGL
jgi:hypothetical protein